MMLEQIENQDLPAVLENFMRTANGLGRLVRMMQRLAQNHQVHAAGFDRRVLQVAQAEFQIFQSVLFRLGRPERDDFFRIIHGDDLLAPPRQQFAQQTFARAQVGHNERRQIRSSKCPNACHDLPGP